jgi:hypothetical protein
MVERLLVMVNYLSKFAPNLAKATAPLRSLLKNDTEFIWDHVHDRAFSQVKDIITKAPVLGYYDPTKPLILETDASKFGVACCLFQDNRPIAFASKSLTQTDAIMKKPMSAAPPRLSRMLLALSKYQLVTAYQDNVSLIHT